MFNVDINFITLTLRNVSAGIALLLFPLLGLVADVWLTRYRMIQTSLLILTSIFSLFKLIFVLFFIVLPEITEINAFKSSHDHLMGIVFDTIPVVIKIATTGIFEANTV